MGAGLVTGNPTMLLVVLGYMVPVAGNNPDQTVIVGKVKITCYPKAFVCLMRESEV